VRFGLSSGRDAALVLMDACLKPQYLQEIISVARSVKGVVGVHNVKIRRSGPYIFGDLHLELDEGIPFEKTHKIADGVERKIKESIVEVDSIAIHTEPRSREKLRVAIPVSEDDGLRSRPSRHFAEAPHFLMVDLHRGEIRGWRLAENPGAKLERRRGITSAKFLVEEKTAQLLTREIGEGPFHLLRDSLVEIYRIPEGLDSIGALEALREKRLKMMTAPKDSDLTRPPIGRGNAIKKNREQAKQTSEDDGQA
jgi:predicted Fe-Mo cluster-binding NifX family protein